MNKYKRIRLKDGTTKDEHRIIMEKELGRKLDRYEVVHHINGNGKDNRLSNLEVKSLSEHSRDHRLGIKTKQSTKNKLSKCFLGEKSPNAKITKKIAIEIRKCLANGGTLRGIGKSFNISGSTVFDIKHNVRWI